MSIDVDAFRDALRHFASGVTIVTIAAEGERHGLTVSAFVSISAEPPLIAVMIDQKHAAHSLLEKPGAVFAVNMLKQGEEELSNRFAFVKDEDRFAVGAWATAETGAPILEDALVWMDCTIHSRHTAGTHTIYVGEVQASGVPEPDAPPLLYWNRDYRTLAETPGE